MIFSLAGPLEGDLATGRAETSRKVYCTRSRVGWVSGMGPCVGV